MNLDTVYLISRLKPVIQDFCTDFSYIEPPLNYMQDIIIEVDDRLVKENTVKTVNGQYNAGLKRITISSVLNFNKIIYTLMHELAHAIQHYNLGVCFNIVYEHQLDLFGYYDCPLEIEARGASNVLNYFNEDLVTNLVAAIRGMMKEHAQQLKRRADMMKEHALRLKRKAMEQFHYEKEDRTKERLIWRAISKTHSTRYKGRR